MIGFILCGIIFCECVFYNDLVENVIIDNLKNRFECEFANECGGLLDGLYRPTPEPIDTPSPTIFDFNDSCIELRENLDLKYMQQHIQHHVHLHQQFILMELI